MEQLTLRWHGHACFALTCQDFTVVFDPYEDNYVPGFPPLHLSADLVLCSHQHNDHNAAGIVSLRTGHDNPFHITEIPTFHDPEGGKLRGTNTIHLLEVGKLRVAHFGDLGCPLTPLQRADLLHLDVAMVPVGGYYTIGPEEAKALIDDLQPKVVIPCTTAWARWVCLPWGKWRTSCPWWMITSTTPAIPSPSTVVPVRKLPYCPSRAKNTAVSDATTRRLPYSLRKAAHFSLMERVTVPGTVRCGSAACRPGRRRSFAGISLGHPATFP